MMKICKWRKDLNKNKGFKTKKMKNSDLLMNKRMKMSKIKRISTKKTKNKWEAFREPTVTNHNPRNHFNRHLKK